ncbi:MAG: hypothetical protein Q7S37_01660 [bacterium]|nr:hypothetical protein [bacterium]
MKQVMVVTLLVLLALSGLAWAGAEIGDFDTGSSYQDNGDRDRDRNDDSYKLEDRTDSGSKETDRKTEFQRFNFKSVYYVDPAAIVAQGKLEELRGKNIMCLSLRRSTMAGGHANDLQVDFFWGDFPDRVYEKNGRIFYDWCDNQLVAVALEQDINISVKSEFITYVQKICEKYIESRGYSLPSYPKEEYALKVKKPHYFRRPGGGQPASLDYYAERHQGIVQILLGAVWNIGGGTRINNDVKGGQGGQGGEGGEGGNGYGAAAAAASSSAAVGGAAVTPTSATSFHGETSGATGSAADGGQ